MNQIFIPYFQKFQCSVCKRPAKVSRFAKSKLIYLCDDKKCNYISDVNVGWADLNIVISEK